MRLLSDWNTVEGWRVGRYKNGIIRTPVPQVLYSYRRMSRPIASEFVQEVCPFLKHPFSLFKVLTPIVRVTQGRTGSAVVKLDFDPRFGVVQVIK